MPGIGTDIEEIARFDKLDRVEHKRFLERIYSEDELAYCYSRHSPAQHLAARFCAKESVIKALSILGISGVSYADIRVERDGSAPTVRIAKGSPAAHCKVALTMSHGGGLALAFALAST